MKRLVSLAGLFLVVSGAVYAANPDTVEVSMTPTVTYSVQITPPGGGFAFGNVSLNTSNVHSSVATVKNNGDVSADWKIKGIALNNWVLGAAPGSNTVRLMAVLKSSLATVAEFDTTNDVINAGEANMDATLYSVNQDGNNVPAAGERSLSLRLDTPTDTSYDTEQKFRIEVKAYPSSSF